MRNKAIFRLIFGFRRFRDRYYRSEDPFYNRLLASGQSPKTLIIGCSDSRVDPAIISSASPGEIFVIRNVANLVPPYEKSGGFHGVSAAIEFAVVNLKVENIIVLGHRQCGGIRALMFGGAASESSFVAQWMKIAQAAKEKILAKFPAPETVVEEEELCRHCEMESIITSLGNLTTFPFIQQAVADGRLELHGAYFDLERGELFEFDRHKNSFSSLELNSKVSDRLPGKSDTSSEQE